MMKNSGYNTVSLIRKKRDGKPLTAEEIEFLIRNYTEERIPDYQMSAFLMAGYLNGFSEEESAALTNTMLHSGKMMDLSRIPGRKIDKHSTGGVGDKLSLILAPIVASCGIAVPMIAGRGLGHTGGTLDKLESIPGFTVDLTLDRFRNILQRQNLVIAGQTREIAPADRRLYALRDVTATVESIPLIAGSIMSKKLAEGIDGLVLDVKVGAGAFMKSERQAVELAQTLVNIGEQFGKETVAYLTDMEQPLGLAIGNWLEVKEGIQALCGEGPEDVMRLSHLLAGAMIFLGGEAGTVEEGIERSRNAVRDGSAWKKWREVVRDQGGDVRVIENPDVYPGAAEEIEVAARKEGYIVSMDAFEIGMSALELGGGRRKKEDTIDPAAGILLEKKVGDKIKRGETFAHLYTNNTSVAESAVNRLTRAVEISESRPDGRDLIVGRVDKNGVQMTSVQKPKSG